MEFSKLALDACLLLSQQVQALLLVPWSLLSASSSFVLAAARLRALQLDPSRTAT